MNLTWHPGHSDIIQVQIIQAQEAAAAYYLKSASPLLYSVAMRSLPVFVLASLLFFGVGIAQLRSPGLMYDEAADAVPAMELLLGQKPSIARSIMVFGHELPLMMLDHIGPASIYTSAAGFALFGISVETLRVTQLCVGWIALLLLWLLAQSWAGDRVTNASVLLAATAPTMVWWSRFGANYTVPLLPIALGMLLALTHAWRKRSVNAAALAAFLLGAGIVTKILFIWLLAPLAITAFVYRRELFTRLRTLPLRSIFVIPAALLLGAAPLLIHNIPDGATLRFILGNAAQTRLYGHDNFAFGKNFVYVVTEFLRAIGGDIRASEAPGGPPLGAVAFVFALVAGIGLLMRRRITTPAFTFALLTPLIVLPLSTVSTSSIGATYVFIIMPLAWLLIAWTITHIAAQRIAWIAIGAVIIANLTGSAVVHAFFARTGGRGHWSDAIFTLSDDLQKNYANRPIVAMDWGFRRNVNLLTQDAVEPVEVFGYAPQPSKDFQNVASVLLRDSSTIYLFHGPQATLFHGRLTALQRAATMQDKELELQHTYFGRDGEPAIQLYTAHDAHASFVISPALTERNAIFANGVTLLGGHITYDTAQHEVRVDLQWRSDTDHLATDSILLHVIDQSNGTRVADGDHQPIYDNRPFDVWQRNEIVLDTYWIKLPPDLPPNVYQIRVGIYDRASGQRRHIDDPHNDAGGDSLMLDTFVVEK